LVGEFGGHRTSKRLECYFKDLIDIFKQNGWHFAFYAFREDTWSGMDYELGDRKLPWNYRQIRPDRVDSVLPDHKMPLAFKVLMDD
jgi:hypothetical protein